MRVLVACEVSGRVRNAFTARGHDAWSCDLETSDIPGQHYQCDVREVMDLGWDLMIAFPPCTYIANSGATWNWRPEREPCQKAAIAFVKVLMTAPIPRIAIENPVGAISYYISEPTQYIHPWQFGHGEKKKTGLWLKNLPKLTPTNVVEGREAKVHLMGQSKNRQKIRGLTYPGVALAMSQQWG